LSVELPEAKILAEQMNQELRGKQVKSIQLKDYERLQRVGMMDKDLTVFDQLVDGKIETVISRGNVIRVKLDNGANLILGPEYGGEIFCHKTTKNVPKFHLRIDFMDGTLLTVRLTSMGVIQALKDDELECSYVYKRDFDSTKLSPIDKEFTFERFSKMMADQNKMLKTVLVGKDAVIVGVSNSTFQDILYRAKIHPKRRASDLNTEEKRSLYDAVRFVLEERIRLDGKDQFRDMYGKQGAYTAAMGPNMKEQTCPECGASIQKLSLGGGHVYLCPNCQT
jgi:formamidopyrimidine-DNA glycosylase